jgi:hypothetical protein
VHVDKLILKNLHIEHGRACREHNSAGQWSHAQTSGISTHFEDCD